jgi:hypothetical protein
MAESDVIRILNKIDSMETKISAMQVKLDTHCAVDTSTGGWKVYMMFTLLGALASQGPAGIAILTKWLGIA